MNVIEAGTPKVRRLLGKQEPRETEYRMMKYVLRSECEDGILLHNVMTGQMVLLQRSEAAFLDGLPGWRKEEMDSLINGYYLVPNEFNEKATVIQLRKLMKRLFPTKGINSYLILTTTNCNARCSYCFENGLVRMDMNEATAEQVVHYIAEHRGKAEVELHWFGGEPLLGKEWIDLICKSLTDKGIRIRSVMTSNGYLFNEEVINKAAEDWKLKRVQITLDGTEAVYNRIKGYGASMESPYRRVLGNVEKLLNTGIQVTLRLNMDDDSRADLENLIVELSESFSERKCLDVYVSKIQRERTREDEAKLDKTIIEMNDCLVQMGLGKRKLRLPGLQINSCMADSDESVVIYPDGRLGKCEDVHDEYVFGRIGSERENGVQEAFRETFEYDYCESCPLYPSCILLRKCPTKQREQYETCQMSISRCKEDLILCYEAHRGEKENA